MADLAARIQAGVAQAIAARTATMVDAGTASRPADVGQTPALDGDGNYSTPDDQTAYSGPCLLARFKSSGARASVQSTVDDADGVPEPRTLKVPHGADVRPGDLWTMTACPFSPELVGQVFRVLHEDPRSYATFRSFYVRGSSWQG